MTVSVVIPTHKRPGPAARLIKSLKEQDFPLRDLQILLVSNLPDKKLEALAMEWKGQFESFKYLTAGSRGVNKARNLGIRFAGGDIVYFLDDDCALPRKSHLKDLVREHKLHPEAAGVGGGYLAPENPLRLEAFYHGMAEKWLWGGLAPQPAGERPQSQPKKRSGPAFQLPGGNCSFKKEIFERGFAFDPEIVFGGSEESFNRLLTDSGRRLFFSERLSVWHFPQVSFFMLAKKAFLQGKGAFFNRLRSGETLKDLGSMKKEGAFAAGGGFSAYSFFYGLFFKMGYFYGLSLERSGGRAFFRWLHFPALIVKSRLYFLREHVALKYGSRLYGRASRLWGHVFLRALGALWFGLGWLWGRALIPAFHYSPPMKIFYFSKYQYYKRIRPKLLKMAARRAKPGKSC